MMRLVNPRKAPPKPEGGLRYADGSQAPATWHFSVVVPLTDTLIEAGDFKELTKKVEEHLLVNRVPVPHPLGPTIEGWICKEIPNYNGCTWEDGSEKRTSIGFAEAANFVTRIAFVMERDNLKCVDESEAARRYSICQTCPAFVSLKGCAGCRQLSAAAVKRWGASEKFNESSLGCSLCSCFGSKVWIPLEVLKQAHATVDFPSWCWENDHE